MRIGGHHCSGRLGPPPRRRHQALTAGLAGSVVAMAVLLGACTAARNNLGTNAGSCFRALPVGESAVHGRGQFSGVLLVKSSSIDTSDQRRILAQLDARAGHKVTSVCLVEYRGSFTQAQVQRPIGPAPPGGIGHYAIAVVDNPETHLLATFVSAREPMRFLHNRVGS